MRAFRVLTARIKPHSLGLLLLCLLVSYCAAFVYLQSRPAFLFSDLSHAELVFPHGERAEAQDLAERLASVGYRALLSPSAEDLTLRVGDTEIVGLHSIEHFIAGASMPLKDISGGMTMIGVLVLSLALLGLIGPSVTAPLIIAAPLLVGALAMPILLICDTCSPAPGALASMSRAGLMMLPIILGICLWSKWQKRLIPLLGITTLATLGTQLALIVLVPKFCVFCLGIGILFVGILIWLADPKRRFSLCSSGAAIPFAASLLVMILSANIAAGLGFLTQSTEAQSAHTPDFVGRSIASYLPPEYGLAATLIIVTLPGCKACNDAKEALQTMNVQFIEVGFCGTVARTNCFRSDSKLIAPLILLVDNSGVIVEQQVGWTTSASEVDSIIRRLTPSVRRK
jgi:hypothetical protein